MRIALVGHGGFSALCLMRLDLSLQTIIMIILCSKVHFPFQSLKFCLPWGNDCFRKSASEPSDCLACCEGLHADVELVNKSLADVTAEDTEDREKLVQLLEEYENFKSRFVENLVFDSGQAFLNKSQQCIPPVKLDYAPLQLIQIYFDANTYDKILRGIKLTPESQLGLIGGTMGLFTGFSILSAIEIIYFAIRFFMSLKITRRERKKN